MMLPNGWKKVKLEDVADIFDGTHQTPDYVDEGVPFVSVENIEDIWSTDKFITKEAFDAYPEKPQKNDILMTRITAGIIGKTAIVDRDDPLAYYVSLALIRCKKDVIFPNYLSHYIEGLYFKKELNKRIIHTAFPKKINLGDIGKCLVEYPPIEEQKKIAATLSVWDSAIEKMEKLIEAKENAKQFFFYKLVRENSCLWEIKKLSDFLTPGNKTPVLNTSLYRKMIVKLHKKGLGFNTQTREMADTRPFYIRNEGELIIGKQNYFNGSIAMVDKEHDQCICSNAIMSFSIKDIHPLYLYEYISDEEYLKKHSMLANGTGQKELSEKDFLNFEIRVPKRKQQDEIACVLNNCSLEIFLLHAQLENYKKQKQGLMQKLLTGQWRVK